MNKNDRIVDARGLACPQPVLLALNALRSGDGDAVTVLVDAEVSKENVSRAAASRGWYVADVTHNAPDYQITIVRTAPAP